MSDTENDKNNMTKNKFQPDTIDNKKVTPSAPDKVDPQDENKLDNKRTGINVSFFIGTFIAIGTIVFGKMKDHALIFSIGVTLLTLFAIFSIHWFKPKPDKTSNWILWIVISIIFSLIIIILIVCTLKTHQNVAQYVYGTPTPTVTPTECPTCEEYPCPTQDSTPCPTFDITPCPNIEITTFTEAESGIDEVELPTIIETPPWNFKDGCISKLWNYIPGPPWDHLVTPDETCSGIVFDQAIGFVANAEGLDVTSPGLMITRPNSDDIRVFGIYRSLPENLSYVEIKLTIQKLLSGENNTTFFRIGFGKPESIRNYKGSFFEFYKSSNKPNIYLYVRDKDFSSNDSEINLGIIPNDIKLDFSCYKFNPNKMLCTYKLDGEVIKEDFEIYLPDKWDSLFIGYDLPKGGTIELHFIDIIIK